MRNIMPLVFLTKSKEEFFRKQSTNDNEMTDALMLCVLGSLFVAICWEIYKNPYLF